MAYKPCALAMENTAQNSDKKSEENPEVSVFRTRECKPEHLYYFN